MTRTEHEQMASLFSTLRDWKLRRGELFEPEDEPTVACIDAVSDAMLGLIKLHGIPESVCPFCNGISIEFPGEVMVEFDEEGKRTP